MMVIALEGRRRWLFFASLAVLVLAYIGLTGAELAASLFARRPDLPSLQRAIHIAPGNADYRERLGRYFAFVASNPQLAVQNFQSAVRLNPYDPHYWFDLASAYQVLGDQAGQRMALDRALQADPTAPNAAWQAANFYLVTGETDSALREFRVVIENDPTLAGLALQSCWRARPDADALLQNVIPARTDSLISFMTLLMSKNDTDATVKVWDHLVHLGKKFDSGILFDYVRYLILARRPEAATAAWEQAVSVLGLSDYLPTPDNLIVNGDFSDDILNGGFDWIYRTQPAVDLLLDPSNFRSGRRSLSITFNGPGISDAGIHEFIPVQAGTTYDFSAYYKCAELEGAGGPQIVLRDAYTGAPLFTSDTLTEADFWKPVQGQITTAPTTTLLILNIERVPAGNTIRGKLWLDDFQLAPAAGASGEHS